MTRSGAPPKAARTPAAVDWRAIDWSAHTHNAYVDGRRVRYVDYGSPEGTPVLLIHGIGGCWQWWLEVLPLVGLYRRVIAVDMPGFGASQPLPPGSEMGAYADVLAAVLKQLGIEHAVVVGHSLGGVVALLYAARHPKRTASVALVCGGGIELGRGRLAVIVAAFRAFNAVFTLPGVARACQRRPRLRNQLFGGGVVDVRAIAPDLLMALVPALSAPGFLDALRSGAAAANELDPAAIKAPMLIIWGEKDPILPVTQARAIAARIPGARLEIMRSVGHCPMLERPAALASLLDDFATASSVS